MPTSSVLSPLHGCWITEDELFSKGESYVPLSFYTSEVGKIGISQGSLTKVMADACLVSVRHSRAGSLHAPRDELCLACRCRWWKFWR